MSLNNKYNYKIEHNVNYFKSFLSIFIFFLLISCSMNTVNKGFNALFKELKQYSVNYTDLDKLIVVKVSTQKLYLINKGKIVNTYNISTN